MIITLVDSVMVLLQGRSTSSSDRQGGRSSVLYPYHFHLEEYVELSGDESWRSKDSLVGAQAVGRRPLPRILFCSVQYMLVPAMETLPIIRPYVRRTFFDRKILRRYAINPTVLRACHRS